MNDWNDLFRKQYSKELILENYGLARVMGF